MTVVETLKSLFDSKKIAIIQVLINNPDNPMTLQEIAKKAKVPLATTYRICKHLKSLHLAEQKKIKHLTLYALAGTKEAIYLKNLLYEEPQPLIRLTELLKGVPNIEKAIVHGKATKDKANIVIIGSNIDKQHVNSIILQIKDEMGFTISHLILEQEQFEILESMGQFSGDKKIIIDNIV